MAGRGKDPCLILHADLLDDASLLEADACIVGAGPVGLLLALRLVEAGRSVLLVESGEDWDEARCQDLNIGTSDGLWAGDLRDIRLRRLGGTMHAWGGNSRPLDPEDLAIRPWMARSGWPVGWAELLPDLQAAHAALDLGPWRYAPAAPALWPDADFEEILFRLSPDLPGPGAPYHGEFAALHRATLEHAPGLTVLLGATVLHLPRSADGRAIAAAEAMTFRGKALRLRARGYVLACGGIETPRLLLASGITGGPGDGAVGACFMEHPHGLAGLLLASRHAPLEPFSPGLLDEGVTVQHRWRLRPEVQARAGLLNLSFQLVATDLLPSEDDIYAADFAALAATVPDPAQWRRYYVTFLSEQEPRPESRITLGPGTDFFGMPQARLAWRLSELDWRTVRRATRMMARGVFGGAGFRFLDRVPETLDAWPIGWGAHHMGTTRMGDDPAHAVLDRNARVHGLHNLFVAGSSVFPTAGMANPMLTALALALRLGRHLALCLPVMGMVPAPAERVGEASFA